MPTNKETAATQRNPGEQLRQQAAKVKDDVQELGHIARVAAQDKFEEVRHHAEDAYKTGLRKAQQLEKSVEKGIREYPIRSVLIAAGVGLVVGFLMRRR
jgi:ElaB/YqjD/DUF883 family membrane-anchored ribosome-binding protein